MAIAPAPVIIHQPRRGLSCTEAATYVGLGQSKFLELVAEKKMPAPVRVDRRVIWDIHELNAAFDALRDSKNEEEVTEDPGNSWGDVAL